MGLEYNGDTSIMEKARVWFVEVRRRDGRGYRGPCSHRYRAEDGERTDGWERVTPYRYRAEDGESSLRYYQREEEGEFRLRSEERELSYHRRLTKMLHDMADELTRLGDTYWYFTRENAVSGALERLRATPTESLTTRLTELLFSTGAEPSDDEVFCEVERISKELDH